VAAPTPWNVYRETLEHSLHDDFDHASEEARASAVSRLIETSSAAAAVLAFQPFPGVDSLLVTPVHQELVEGIAHIRGFRLDRHGVFHEIVYPLGRRLVVQHAAMAATKLIPFADFLAVPVAYALTLTLGQVADDYFRRGRSMSPEELRTCFDAVYKVERAHAVKEKRDELRALFREPEVRRRVEEVKEAGRRGALSPEQVDRAIGEILRRN
jgi:uncharacterized protein (DUF697 family)